MIGCDCDVCLSTNTRNQRYRCSVLISGSAGNLLIDTGPELRLQLLREHVKMIHSVLYTHYHADHLMGLDDLRLFPKMLGEPLPVYCTEETEDVIRQAFSYAFRPELEYLPPGAIPRMAFRRIDDRPVEILGERVVPIPLKHAQYNVLGFRFDKVAYCTDVKEIPDTSWPLLEGLDVLVIDALRQKPHNAHFSLDEALDVIEQVKPKRAYLTHMGHELEYEAISRYLPPSVAMAFDGLKFTF
jgi:phosphoribosyl 1,2-cyclic phosphate phosphodiesterase